MRDCVYRLTRIERCRVDDGPEVGDESEGQRDQQKRAEKVEGGGGYEEEGCPEKPSLHELAEAGNEEAGEGGYDIAGLAPSTGLVAFSHGFLIFRGMKEDRRRIAIPLRRSFLFEREWNW